MTHGVPVQPRYLMTDGGGAALSSPIFTKGITMSSGGHYAGMAPGSNAVHIQQNLFTNAVNPQEFKQPGPQGKLGLLTTHTKVVFQRLYVFLTFVFLFHKWLFFLKVFQCYQPNPMASHLNAGLFSPSMFYQVGEWLCNLNLEGRAWKSWRCVFSGKVPCASATPWRFQPRATARRKHGIAHMWRWHQCNVPNFWWHHPQPALFIIFFFMTSTFDFHGTWK